MSFNVPVLASFMHDNMSNNSADSIIHERFVVL